MTTKCCCIPRIIWVLLACGPVVASAERVSPPQIRIAELFHHDPQAEWTDAEMDRVKALGFNQLTIGDLDQSGTWGDWTAATSYTYIPTAGVVLPGEPNSSGAAQRRVRIEARIRLAKKHGLRTLFIAAAPTMGRNPYSGVVSNDLHLVQGILQANDDTTFDSWYDIANPKVQEREVAVVKAIRTQFPGLDDILFYTYDAGAWQTPEFQFSKYSYGTPIGDKLPGFVTALKEAWTDGRPDARFWWEPWELSAGEVYAMLPRMPRTGFGLIVHSNIAEAQLAQPVDVWVRNTARMCQQLGIPVVVESFFGSATEEIEPLEIPAPRLVDEEYQAFTHVPGVVGIKEYYGLDVDSPDLDLDLLQLRQQEPNKTTDELLTQITRRFGAAQPEVYTYLGLLADALQVYPWDASWFARDIGRASPDHGWSAATIKGAYWNTPLWASTRHARFMQTDSSQPSFWMLEDVQLRAKLTADLLDQADTKLEKFLPKLSDAEDREEFQRMNHDVDIVRHVARSYDLHLRETNVAQLLRQDIEANRAMTPRLVGELGKLLEADVRNQGDQGRVVEMKRLYEESPEQFVRRYLIPASGAPNERGPFTLTSR